jgi:hypothetical protein
MSETFDPFSDRTARDIRNSLSSALVADLGAGTDVKVNQVAGTWMQTHLPPLYQEYIRQTLERYRRAAGQIQAAGIRNPRHQVPVLWNAGLFFEVHELLEGVWRVARGDTRTGLKGLIQAAGVYVHQMRGNAAAARGLAARARRNLLAGRDQLVFIADFDELIQSLEDPSRTPPVLRMTQ